MSKMLFNMITEMTLEWIPDSYNFKFLTEVRIKIEIQIRAASQPISTGNRPECALSTSKPHGDTWLQTRKTSYHWMISP